MSGDYEPIIVTVRRKIQIFKIEPGALVNILQKDVDAPDVEVYKCIIPRDFYAGNGILDADSFIGLKNNAAIIKAILAESAIGLGYYGDREFVEPRVMPDETELEPFPPNGLSSSKLNAIDSAIQTAPPRRTRQSSVGTVSRNIQTRLREHALLLNDNVAKFKKVDDTIRLEGDRSYTTVPTNLTIEWLLHKLQIGRGNDGDHIRKVINSEYIDRGETSKWPSNQTNIHSAMGISGYAFSTIGDFKNRPRFLPLVTELRLYIVFRRSFTNPAPTQSEQSIPIPISFALVTNSSDVADTTFLIGVWNSAYGMMRYYDAITRGLVSRGLPKGIYPRGTARMMMRLAVTDLNHTEINPFRQQPYRFMGMYALYSTRQALMRSTSEFPAIPLYRYKFYYYYNSQQLGEKEGWRMWPLSTAGYQQLEGDIDSQYPSRIPDGSERLPNYLSMAIANELDDVHWLKIADLMAPPLRPTVITKCISCRIQPAQYRCGACADSRAVYCGIQCQKTDWYTIHQHECTK